MRSTLFVIPHQWLGIPLFGFGWLLGLLVLGFLAWSVWTLRQRGTGEWVGGLPVWAIGAGIIAFLLPNVEMTAAGGTPLGLPIRGYGVMVLLGLLLGIAISVYRARQLHIDPELVVGLGFWMMLGGVLGARAFYVIQKWEEFDGGDLASKAVSILKLTEGGLVIYGGVIGGLAAGAWYSYRHRLNVLATADLVAPGFLVGLALGRIGCLFHGCCFGGVCTAELPSITFPPGSGAYQSQLADGELLGLQIEKGARLPSPIQGVRPGSLAEQVGAEPGQRLKSLQVSRAGEEPASPFGPPRLRADVELDGKRLTVWPSQMPPRSLPVHPSQIYAAINALLLCLLVWQLQPLPRRDGVAFCVAILLYALSRFLLEGVRSDESGQLGTALTIAQIVSILSAAAAVGGLLLLRLRPARRVWDWPRPGGPVASS